MLEWEAMTPAERWAAKELGEHDPLTFMRVWFQLTQGERLKINWHHRLFNDVAIRLLNKEIQNAIINVAPGSTKTEFWSIHLPAYCFAKFPKARILNTSYSKDLVSENSERTRSIIKSAEWQELYGHEIGNDKQENWTINGDDGKRKHQIFSKSSGGTITGVRGGYMTGKEFSGYVTMDDWQKPDDMFSELKRTRSNQRASNTLRSRRGDHLTPIISIQQRLHSEDVTQFLLSGGLGMEFEQIKIPALINEEYIESLPPHIREHCWNDVKDTDCVNGYYSFFPAKESVHDLMALWDSDPYTFMSQYMQAPESLSGGIFKADAFNFYSTDADLIADGAALPRPAMFEYRLITADTAQKTKEHNDFTVLAEWGVYQGRIYLINLLRGKWEAPALRQNATSFINAATAKNGTMDGNLRSVYIEDKVSGTGLIQEIKSKVRTSVVALQRERDKFTRAMDVQAHQLAGKVVLEYGAPHNNEFIAEVASFTPDDTHKHDDQTDNMIDALEIAILSQTTGGGFVNLFGS